MTEPPVKDGIPLPVVEGEHPLTTTDLYPFCVQVATLLEVSGATLLNYKLNYYFGRLLLNSSLDSISALPTIPPPPLVVLNYNIVIRC